MWFAFSIVIFILSILRLCYSFIVSDESLEKCILSRKGTFCLVNNYALVASALVETVMQVICFLNGCCRQTGMM